MTGHLNTVCQSPYCKTNTANLELSCLKLGEDSFLSNCAIGDILFFLIINRQLSMGLSDAVGHSSCTVFNIVLPEDVKKARTLYID